MGDPKKSCLANPSYCEGGKVLQQDDGWADAQRVETGQPTPNAPRSEEKVIATGAVPGSFAGFPGVGFSGIDVDFCWWDGYSRSLVPVPMPGRRGINFPRVQK